MMLDAQHTALTKGSFTFTLVRQLLSGHDGEFRYSFQDNILYGVDNPENISENFLQVLEIRNSLKHWLLDSLLRC